MPTDRRQFLVFLGATAALSACRTTECDDGLGIHANVGVESVIERAPPRLPADPNAWPHCTREQAIAIAWSRAQSLAKPLLVVLIPSGSNASWHEVSDLFGGLLNHGSRQQLGMLALMELACATRVEVERVTGARWNGEALCVIVDPLEPIAVSAIDPELEQRFVWSLPPQFAHAPPASVEELYAEFEHNVERRSQQLARAIRETLLPDAAALDRLVALSRERAPAAIVDRVATCSEALAPSDALAHAALVHATATDRPAYAEKLLDVLVAGVRERWVEAAPPGALWSSDGRCSACGMGYVPEYCRRFLCLYQLEPAS